MLLAVKNAAEVAGRGSRILSDALPFISRKINIRIKIDGGTGKGIPLINKLSQARKVLGGIEREGLGVGIGVIPTRVGGAVPRIDGVRGAGADGRGDERCEGK